MGKTVLNELLLANGQKVDIHTSTRKSIRLEESTFISIDTGAFRIHIVQRSSMKDVSPEKATIGFSTTSETTDLDAIETLALSLQVAREFAEQLNSDLRKEKEQPICQ